MKLLNATPPKERLFQVELSETEIKALTYAIMNCPGESIGYIIKPAGHNSYYNFCTKMQEQFNEFLKS